MVNPYASKHMGPYDTTRKASEFVEMVAGHYVRAGYWVTDAQDSITWINNHLLKVIYNPNINQWFWVIVGHTSNTDYRDGSHYFIPAHAQIMCKCFYRHIIRGDSNGGGRRVP